MSNQSSELLNQAINLASESIDSGGGPFGALVVRNGKVIATGSNMVTSSNDPTAHAEVMAIRKASAILDDILNYIPSRITAVLIMLVTLKNDVFSFYEDGQKHDSPNAGHPITAMALFLGVKLGGDTSYFGKVKHKANFGNGVDEITSADLEKALSIKPKIDLVILVSLALLYMIIISL